MIRAAFIFLTAMFLTIVIKAVFFGRDFPYSYLATQWFGCRGTKSFLAFFDLLLVHNGLENSLVFPDWFQLRRDYLFANEKRI